MDDEGWCIEVDGLCLRLSGGRQFVFMLGQAPEGEGGCLMRFWAVVFNSGHGEKRFVSISMSVREAVLHIELS